MGKKNFFLLYVKGAKESEDQAKSLQEKIVDFGGTVNDLNAPDVKEALRAAEYLICFAFAPEEMMSKQFEECWRYFDNELSWKRKTSGEILLVLEGEQERYRIPFRLREKRVFSFHELSLRAILENSEPTAKFSQQIPVKAEPLKPETKVKQQTENPPQSAMSETQPNLHPDKPKITREDEDDLRVGKPPYDDAHRYRYPSQNEDKEPMNYSTNSQDYEKEADLYDPFTPDRFNQPHRKVQNNKQSVPATIITITIFIIFFIIGFSAVSNGSCSGFLELRIGASIQNMVQSQISKLHLLFDRCQELLKIRTVTKLLG